MKNFTSIAWTLIITFLLTAFAYSNWTSPNVNKLGCQTTIKIEPPTFFYNLSSGCPNTISKERIHKAKTVSDLMPDHGMQENLKNNISTLRDVEIKIEDDKALRTNLKSEKRNENILSDQQLDLLKSTDYFTNFFLEGYSIDNNPNKDLNKERYFNYCMTVVPVQQAAYKAGNNAFIDFLKRNCQPSMAKVKSGNLKSGNISFTVTKAGTISNIVLRSTCGYPGIDKKMMDLMNDLPDEWIAATNGKGEKVNQTFVFSYGQGGC